MNNYVLIAGILLNTALIVTNRSDSGRIHDEEITKKTAGKRSFSYFFSSLIWACRCMDSRAREVAMFSY